MKQSRHCSFCEADMAVLPEASVQSLQPAISVTPPILHVPSPNSVKLQLKRELKSASFS